MKKTISKTSNRKVHPTCNPSNPRTEKAIQGSRILCNRHVRNSLLLPKSPHPSCIFRPVSIPLTPQDPILARSKSQSKSLESAKTEHRIRKALAAQKKALRSIGHIEDLSTYNAKELEYERSMKKTAQRGVVKLFNAVRASQIKAEQALLEAKGAPRAEREEKVKEMSREGFLNLIKSG